MGIKYSQIEEMIETGDVTNTVKIENIEKTVKIVNTDNKVKNEIIKRYETSKHKRKNYLSL